MKRILVISLVLVSSLLAAEWNFICPLCKAEGKKSTISQKGMVMVWVGEHWQGEFECSRGHFIYYRKGKEDWTVTASEKTGPYWDENGVHRQAKSATVCSTNLVKDVKK